MRRGLQISIAMLALGPSLIGLGAAQGSPGGALREGGTFRVVLVNLDYIDPALSYSPQGWALLDTTCARLMAYPDKPPPAGFRIVPEVAAGPPRVSQDRKTYTFRLRSGFRFSDGTPVRASAFARAINRTLSPAVTSPGAQYTQDIVGAEDVQAGRASAAAGVIARGNRLVVRFKRSVPDFPARTTMPFFCAVPPTLPSDREGVGAFPAAGPYYVAEYRPGERVLLRRNRFYRGKRPHHVDRFEVDLKGSAFELPDKIERGDADWGYILSPIAFDPARRLAEKYGVNKSQFYVKPGLTFRMFVLNTSRPLFRNNPKLRRAVNFAIDRAALVRAVSTPLSGRLTDQYLPPTMPRFRDARIYPLSRADLRRARALAKGNTRSGKAVFYVPAVPPALTVAQLVKQQLAKIGLDVEVKPIPFPAFAGRLSARDEAFDMGGPLFWAADYFDPYSYINLLLDGQFIGEVNASHFDSAKYNKLMRRAARLDGEARYRVYSELDVRLARDAAPLVAIDYFNEPTLVSKRVGCVVLRPSLDLTAVCLK